MTILNANEYITKGDVMQILQNAYTDGRIQAKDGCASVLDDIAAIKADVQPVDRWISVNEALPIYDGLVLICYNDKRIRLGVYTEDGWDSDEGNPIMEQPDFWVRIPEPPKQ